MEEATVWRILGNELFPRDEPGRRLEILEHILKNEPKLEGAQKWYMVNRIADIPWRRCVVEMLDRYDAHYVTVPFDRNTPPTVDALKLRGVGVNQARNDAIRYGHAMTAWSVILDGDCIFTEAGWKPVIGAMKQGGISYLSIPHVREGSDVRGEPMLAFHCDSGFRFDETIPFGQGDKLQLLYHLGHAQTPESGHLEIAGTFTRLVGEVIHMTTGDPDLEDNLYGRERSREISFKWLAGRVKNWPRIELKMHGSFGRKWEAIDGYFDYSGLYSSIAFDVHDGARIVEVGSWQGKSAIYLATQIKAMGKRAHVHCVDSFDGGTDKVLNSRIEEIGGSNAVFDILQRNIRKAQVHYMMTTHASTSVEAAKYFPDNSLSAVFIDADHSYDAVMSDLETWYPKVKPGGMLAGHDFDFDSQVSREGVIPAVLDFFQGMSLEVMPSGRVWKHICYKDGDPQFPDSVNPRRRRRLWA